MPKLSVALCTFNRAVMLDGALSSLCHQAVAAESFEIVVVDNGSTDDTVDVVTNYQAKYPHLRIELVCEERQGLGYARNTALAHALGHYIAYLDDDAQVSPHWMAIALVLLNRQPEALICLGGPIVPFYTTPKPVWFKDAYEIRSLGPASRRLNRGESFPGSNMIWRREKLLELGGFDETVGVRGTELSLGEETAAFAKAWRQWPKPLMQFSTDLVVEHWVPHYKMKVSYHLKRSFVDGQVAVKIGHIRYGRPYLLLGALKGLLLGPFQAVSRIKKHRYWQNWAIEEGQPLLLNIGKILATFGIYLSVQQE